MNYANALNEISNYKYALLYKFSELRLCMANEVSKADFDECMEARFFSKNGEIHLFPQEELAYKIVDTEEKPNVSDIKYTLKLNHVVSDTLSSNKTTLVVRRYLSVDDDGQTYIAKTRLYDIC